MADIADRFGNVALKYAPRGIYNQSELNGRGARIFADKVVGAIPWYKKMFGHNKEIIKTKSKLARLFVAHDVAKSAQEGEEIIPEVIRKKYFTFDVCGYLNFEEVMFNGKPAYRLSRS
jgi:hypothetical protein